MLRQPCVETHYGFFVCVPSVRLLISTIGFVLVTSMKNIDKDDIVVAG
jgi:hypothetical protein